MINDYTRHHYIDHRRNCAESILLSTGEAHGIEITTDVLKAVGVFGGGIGCGRLCGAAAGSVCAIGLKHNSGGNAHKNPHMTAKAKTFMTEFTELFGSDLCQCIKPIYYHEQERCLEVVEKTGEILEKYLS